MSISFFFPHDTEIKHVEVCDCDGEDEECKWCSGTGEFTWTTPTLGFNLCNSNASALFTVLGFNEAECTGAWKNSSLGDLRRRIIKAKNSLKRVKLGVRQDYQEGNFYSFGLSEDRILSYLERLEKLALAAQASGDDIVWG